MIPGPTLIERTTELILQYQKNMTMKKILFAVTLVMSAMTTQARTLIVYYSYTNNVEQIVNELSAHASCGDRYH